MLIRQSTSSGERLYLRCYNGNTEFAVHTSVTASANKSSYKPVESGNKHEVGSTVSYYLNGSRWATDTHNSAISVNITFGTSFGSAVFTNLVRQIKWFDL